MHVAGAPELTRYEKLVMLASERKDIFGEKFSSPKIPDHIPNLTHPIIILFNALVTGKRIIFLGHNIPAGQVANYVLSACALGSGCGAILRGFIERAFPYAGLAGGEDWVTM
jgi:hypothetical protein